MMRRRSFVTAALAAGPALRAQAPAVPANEGVGILAVGVRGMGGGDARAAARYGRIVGVCDVDSASTDKFLAGLGAIQETVPRTYKDYRIALEQKDIDVVTIGTPDHWHTAILLAALRAGKDVYCEKPMTLTIDEGRKICRAVKETGRVVQVGTQQRTQYERMFLKAVVMARSGLLGSPLTATVTVGSGPTGGPFPVVEPPATLDWDFWLGQAPKAPYSVERCHGRFRYWFEYSGGILTDWGAHHVDIAQWALGAENTGPVEIDAQGELPLGRAATLAALNGRKPQDFPNSFSTARTFRITLKFANGNTMIVCNSPGSGIKLEGDRNWLWVSRESLAGPAVEEMLWREKRQPWIEDEVIKLYGGPVPARHMENFIQCVRKRSQPISDVFTHHRALSSCHLCNIGLLLGRKLRWDPREEDFVGDPEASALRSREQRRGYSIEG